MHVYATLGHFCYFCPNPSVLNATVVTLGERTTAVCTCVCLERFTVRYATTGKATSAVQGGSAAGGGGLVRKGIVRPGM
jgi:hypothetical protein